MEWIALVTLLVAAEYMFMTIMVGKSRGESGISAPKIIGDEKFERVFRVQQNTLEQLIIFFPALWLFGYYMHPQIGALLGLAFLIGRVLYARGYIADPGRRGPGFVIGILATLALLLGGFVGAGLKLL
jgi:uncharacterized MAPEG superfamily protein